MNVKKQKDDFIHYVLEQLSGLPDITCKRMFGGHGLYRGEFFFGILHRGRLYFKTDESSKAVYEEHGMGAFSPSEKVILKHYYEVPVSVLEDSETLEDWARQAVEVAKLQPPKKKP